MKRFAVAFALVLVVLAVLAGPALTAPKPSELPTSWELNVKLGQPRLVKLTLPGYDKQQRFWYMTYTVTNRTGADRLFIPEFVLYTDTGKILRGGQRVPTAAFNAIKKMLNNPLLKDATAATGKLLQGADNARDSIAIWREFDPKAGAFDIFFGGLSGETVEVKLPAKIQVTEIDSRGKVVKVTKDRIILSKTMQLSYSIPGEAAARVYTNPEFLSKRWVMR